MTTISRVWHDCVDQPPRWSQPEVRANMTLVSSTFTSPPRADAGFWPTRGDVVPAAARFFQGSASTVDRLYVYSVLIKDVPGQSPQQAVITFYRPRFYPGTTPTATDGELADSRQQQTGSMTYTATRLFISTDGTTNIPVVKGMYPDDDATFGRRVREVSDSLEVMPGLHYHVASYVGPRFMVGTTPSATTGELNGSRKVEDEKSRYVATRFFVSTDGTSQIPVYGDMYPGDTGLGKRVSHVATNPEEIPGLYYHTVSYIGPRFMAGTTPSATGGELNGSRQIQAGVDRYTATRMFVSTDGSSGVPVYADIYPADALPFGKRVVNVTDVPEEFPGLHYHVTSYVGPRLLSGGLLTATCAELNSSRQLDAKPDRLHATRWFVSTDGATDVPVRGDLYVDDSSPFGRVCTDVTDKPEEMPGLHYMTVSYVGPRFFPDTTPSATCGELYNSRQVDTKADRYYATRTYVSTDGETGVPVYGDVYVGDTAPFGKRVYESTDNPNELPGIHYHTVRYAGPRLLAGGLLTATCAELQGSRQRVGTSTRDQIVRTFVSTDGVTDVPVEGETYLTESGALARRVVSVSDAPEELPGLHYHKVSYAGFRAFALGEP